MKYITYEQHIKKHTLKENTHCFECPFCEDWNLKGGKLPLKEVLRND